MAHPTLPRRAPRLVVAGAGAFGLASALVLARRGAQVTVCDPAALGDNASGVAAGMLAPALETALDPDTGLSFAELAAARDLWTDFAAETGIALDRSGALVAGPEAERVAAALRAAGASHRILTAAEAAGLSAGKSSRCAGSSGSSGVRPSTVMLTPFW